MVEPIRYGAGGIPMVNQEPPKVEPVEKISKDKKQKQIYKSTHANRKNAWFLQEIEYMEIEE